MTKVHTIKGRTRYVVEDDRGRQFEVRFEPAAYQDVIVEDLADGTTVVGYLSDDDEPPNPRENDNLGVMVCWHDRYDLGDKHAYENPEDLWRDLLGDEAYDGIEIKYAAAVDQWHLDNPGESFGSPAHQKWTRDICSVRERETQRRLAAAGYTILPLYLYDHSGITISVGNAFSGTDPGGWDTSAVGYIYAGPAQAEKVGGPKDKVVEGLKVEVREYDLYLTGECFGVCVEVFGPGGGRLSDEACWGCLGDEWARQSLAEEVAAARQAAAAKAADQEDLRRHDALGLNDA